MGVARRDRAVRGACRDLLFSLVPYSTDFSCSRAFEFLGLTCASGRRWPLAPLLSVVPVPSSVRLIVMPLLVPWLTTGAGSSRHPSARACASPCVKGRRRTSSRTSWCAVYRYSHSVLVKFNWSNTCLNSHFFCLLSCTSFSLYHDTRRWPMHRAPPTTKSTPMATTN